ncbi:hypothetical protein [Microbacterium deminutum]|uniref:Minor tail protein n=1 Tax=Microbacterium deminutum TaxID=344164 RepID=A0ABN2RJU9_9MICO
MSAGMMDEVEAFIEMNIARTPPFPLRSPEGLRARADAVRNHAKTAYGLISEAGVDVRGLDELAKQGADARHARTEKERLRAIEASAAAGNWLSEHHPVMPDDPGATDLVIDQVTFIRTFGAGDLLTDWNISSLHSWARYRLHASSETVEHVGQGRLSFFILWRNPSTRAIVASVGPRIIVNAYVAVEAEWQGVADWFFGGSEARGTVRVRTTVWAMWDPSVSGVVSDVILGSAGATGGFFGGDDSISLAVNQWVPGTGFSVPGHASILIEVSLLTDYNVTNGSLDLDAASGDFQIWLPFLRIRTV